MTDRLLDDPAYLADQRARLEEAHVSPLSAIARPVDPVVGASMPCVAPDHGGIDAPIMTILKSPNVTATQGTGLLSVRNPDRLSARQRELMDANGLTMKDITPWNAFPWFATDESRGSIERGAMVLAKVFTTFTRPRAVLLMGADARKAWSIVENDLGRRADGVVVLSCSLPVERLWNQPRQRAAINSEWSKAAFIAQQSR